MHKTLALVAAALLAAANAAADTVVITADRMVDVLAGRIVERPVVVVTDGRIVSVGTGAAPTPAGARRIDLPGRTLLPGLIDMHVHLGSVATIKGYESLRYTDSFWAVASVAAARAILAAGFTTVRTLGSRDYADIGVKQAIEAGLIPGPRIVAAAHALGATGGHCDSALLPPSLNRRGPGVANGPQAFRDAVREQRKFGAEVIKICATGGVFSRNTEPGQQQLSEVEMRAAVEEAHQWGLRVAAHAHGAEGIKAAIRAGVDTVEHASLIDAEGIALAGARGTALSMDIFNSEYTQREGPRNGVLPESLRKDREVTARQREGFRRAHAAGVKLVFGSDAGVMPHATAAGQFAWMVRFGMTPMQAIQSATARAAEALGRADVGAIAVGRHGDMIAVMGDPLGDVRALETIDTVIKGGVAVPR